MEDCSIQDLAIGKAIELLNDERIRPYLIEYSRITESI